MKESLEATLKDVELTKEVYRLYTLEHLTQQEISVKLCIGRSTVWRKIRTFEAENPELAEKMKKQGKEITPSDYKDLVKEIAELKKQLKTERLRADFYEEMVAPDFDKMCTYKITYPNFQAFSKNNLCKWVTQRLFFVSLHHVCT